MITLRQDQLDAVQEVAWELKRHQSVLLHAECGWGKTVVAAYMALGADKKLRRVIFGVHRRELARQTAKTFQRFGIRYGYIAAGMRADPFARVQIASADTLRNRPEKLACDLFVPDEAHLWGGPTRSALIDEIRQLGAKIVPLTATPEQGNGRGLAHIADHIVHGPGAAWLIERGHLARYRVFAPASPDLSGLHVRQGDYVTSELDERFGKPQVIGDRVAAYKRFAAGKRMIGYCYSRKNGEETADAFRSGGIAAAFLDGDTPDAQRVKLIEAFADRRIPVLLNCQLFREGFDLSAQVGRKVPIEAAGLYTPTKSLPLAIQMMMRPMRPQDDPAVLLDHVNLIANHGFPDDEREWSLEGRRKTRGGSGDAAMPTVTCLSCFGVFKPGEFKATFVDGEKRMACPGCGELREIEGREVAEVEGEIGEVDVEAIRRARKMEVGRARTLEELVKVAKARGYKAGWIMNTLTARGEKPTYEDVARAMR